MQRADYHLWTGHLSEWEPTQILHRLRRFQLDRSKLVPASQRHSNQPFIALNYTSKIIGGVVDRLDIRSSVRSEAFCDIEALSFATVRYCSVARCLNRKKRRQVAAPPRTAASLLYTWISQRAREDLQ